MIELVGEISPLYIYNLLILENGQGKGGTIERAYLSKFFLAYIQALTSFGRALA